MSERRAHAAAVRELDVLPRDSRVGERGAHRHRAHLIAGDPREPTERMDPDPDDCDVHQEAPPLATGWNAYIITSRPASSWRSGNEGQLHLHADVHRVEITVDESSFDPHLLRQLDVAEEIRDERLVGRVDEVGLLGHEPLCGPRVERAATVEGLVPHVGRAAPSAAALARKGHDAARAAAAPDELGPRPP